MAEGDAAKTAKELAEVGQQLDLALSSNKDNFYKLISIMETLGPEIEANSEELERLAEKYGTTVDSINKIKTATDESIERRLLEGNLVKARSQKELQIIVNQMEHLEKLEKSGKIKLSELQKAIIRSHKFELEQNKIKVKIMAAEHGGLWKMFSARMLDVQSKFQEGMHKFFGISVKTDSALSKTAGSLTLVGVGLMIAMSAFQKLTRRMEEVSNATLRAGGFMGRSWAAQAIYAQSFGMQMTKAAGFGMTFNQLMDAFKDAVNNGAIALAKMTLEQEKALTGTSQDQDLLISKTIQASAELQKIGTAIFGSTEFMPQIIKNAKYFRLNLTNEVQAMLMQIYTIAKDSGVSSQSLMNVISAAGEKAFMTGQNIMETVKAMSAIEIAFSEVTKNAAEAEALFDALGKAVSGFDTIKYMAVMNTNAANIGEQYGEALKKGPIQALSAYINTLAGQIGGPNIAEKLALAMPEIRQMGASGVALMKAITSKGFQDRIAGVKTEEEFKEALLSTGKVSEEIAGIGAAALAGKDVQEKILDVITKLQSVVLDGFATLIRILPGFNKEAELGRFLKNASLENANKGTKMIKEIKY